MYSGMEMASAIARKSQSAETDNGAQYISFTDLGPAITRFDAVIVQYLAHPLPLAW